MFIFRACIIPALAFACLSAIADPPTVVIDPGHPAAVGDFGARGKKLIEVQVNYHVATLLYKMLRQQGVNAMLTKPDERLMLTNERRAEIANWAKADLFIRLHCDETTGTGFLVIYPAAPGKAPDGTQGPSQHIINASTAAAKKFHAAMAAALKGELTDNGLRTDAQTPVGKRQGALTGSIYSKTPTFLVDMAVLTNPKDEAWLLNVKDKNVQKLASAIEKGVLAALNMQ